MLKRISLGIVLCLLLTLSTAQASLASVNSSVLLENHVRQLDSILSKPIPATPHEKPTIAALPVIQTVGISTSVSMVDIPAPDPIQEVGLFPSANYIVYVAPDAARAIGRQLALSIYGWGNDQFSCLDTLWTNESGWSDTIENPYSSALGIAQALPGTKYVTGGFDYSVEGQIKWGLQYIATSPNYGTPCRTLSLWTSRSPHWY